MKNRLFKTTLLLITLSGSLSNLYGMEQGQSAIIERIKAIMPQTPSTSSELLSLAQKGFWPVANILTLGYLAERGIDCYKGLTPAMKLKIRNIALGTAGTLSAATAGLAYFKRPLFDYFCNAAKENAPKIFSGVTQALSSPSTTALLTGCIAGIFYLRKQSSERKNTVLVHEKFSLEADLAIEKAGSKYKDYSLGNNWTNRTAQHKPKQTWVFENHEFLDFLKFYDQQFIDLLAQKIISELGASYVQEALKSTENWKWTNKRLIKPLDELTKATKQ